MIFVTIGTQLPFDRLVRAVDEWILASETEHEVFGQVILSGKSAYRPRNFQSVEHLSPQDYEKYIDRADIVVSHAGMGTILTALTLGKIICVMPRRFDLGEHRNDHQLATVSKLRGLAGIFVAEEEDSVPATMDEALRAVRTGNMEGQGRIPPCADKRFTDKLRKFILS